MGSRKFRIKRDDSVLVAIDYQEKLMPVMNEIDRLRDKISRLTRGIGVLNIPAIATEQYPKGLGRTENFEEFEKNLGGVTLVEKDSFSAFGAPDFEKIIEATSKKTILLCGIETHICVQQTALDFLERGYRVILIVDCCSSRSAEDKAIALSRMEQTGVELVTVEALLFDMIEGNKDPEFKDISRIIK